MGHESRVRGIVNACVEKSFKPACRTLKIIDGAKVRLERHKNRV